jgi:hypothetical protein
VHVATRDQINPNAIVVVPEVYRWLLPSLRHCRVYFWWLSVDNCNLIALGRLARLLPKAIVKQIALREVRKFSSAHLYQSEYARIFACRNNLRPNFPLSDYLGPPFIEAARAPRADPRENVVLYNPAKGLERTKLVLDRLRDVSPVPVQAVAIRDMSRGAVLAHLMRAKVYIDFGNHPGKDRIPREAAACGCCVLTNRRGSASNGIDVPIPDDYKMDDTDPDFVLNATQKIVDICVRFDDHAPNFEAYRRSIAEEPDLFAEQVAAIFGSVTQTARRPSVA